MESSKVVPDLQAENAIFLQVLFTAKPNLGGFKGFPVINLCTDQIVGSKPSFRRNFHLLGPEF